MMISTLTAAAILLAPGASNSIPSWQADYSKAMTAATAEQKPMAVFIGKGATAAASVVTEGNVPAKATDLLGDHVQYVVRYQGGNNAGHTVVIGEEILELKKQIRVTSIVVSHDRDLAFGVADRIAIINEGRIVTVGTPDEVKRFNDPLVQRFLHADLNREPQTKPL